MKLNYSVFEASDRWKHYAELALQLLQVSCSDANVEKVQLLRDFTMLPNDIRTDILKYVPCYVFLSPDGGSDHNNTLVQNQAAPLALVLFLKIAGLVNNRNVPDDSWINCVDRAMQLLNIGIAHQSVERDKCHAMEQAVKVAAV
jgi:hypothetical protein